MVFVFGKDGDAQGKEAFTVRSQAPDVVVLVGSGDSRQEFKCYKVILSFASDYLDAMLSSSMKEGEMSIIEFPDKDPEEWKLFYDFIAPPSNRSAVITDANVTILLPWFHEFGIDAFVTECDAFLSAKYLSNDELQFWDKEQQSEESEEEHQARLGARKSKFEAILGVLTLSSMYSLPSTKAEMERRIAVLLDMLLQTHDLFDIASVKSLLQGLPFELVNETGLTISEGESDHLLPACEEILLPYVPYLTQDIIDNEIYFPHLFYSYMQSKVEKERAAAVDASSGVGILRAIIHDVPNYLYQEMPQHTGGRVDHLARDKLKEVISNQHKENLQNLGITLPNGYP